MNLIKSGAGTQTLSGNNSYTGGTSVNQGTVAIGHNAGFGTGSVAIASVATVSNSAGLSNLANTFTGNGSFTTGTGQASITGNWSGFSGTVTTAAGADMVFNGAFSSGVSDTTSANAAYVNNYNLNNTNGMIVQNQTGSTVTYKLGSYASAVGSNLRNSGAATGSVIFEIGNLNTNTTVAGTIGGGAQTTSLTKVGSGTLTLSGANTYTGTTTISGGTLLLGFASAISGSSVTLSGGVLSSNVPGAVTTSGTLSLAAATSSVIDFGSGGTTVFTFTGGAGSEWAGNLQVWNWSSGAGQLFVGSSATLSSGQLSQVEFFSGGSGSPSLGLANQTSFGELVPVPEPTALLTSLAAAACAFRRRRVSSAA